jgi:hypothetical protein
MDNTPEQPKKRRRSRGPLSAETRAKISAATKGIPKSPEHREKMSAASAGKPKSPEHREKMSQAHILKWQQRREAHLYQNITEFEQLPELEQAQHRLENSPTYQKYCQSRQWQEWMSEPSPF